MFWNRWWLTRKRSTLFFESACTSLIEPELSYITKLNDAWIQIIDYIAVSSMYTTTTKNRTVFLTLTQSTTCTHPFIFQEWTHNDTLQGERGGHKVHLASGSHILYYFTYHLFGHKRPETQYQMHISLLFAPCRLCTFWIHVPLQEVDPWIMSKASIIYFYWTYFGDESMTNLGGSRFLPASSGKL